MSGKVQTPTTSTGPTWFIGPVVNPKGPSTAATVDYIPMAIIKVDGESGKIVSFDRYKTVSSFEARIAQIQNSTTNSTSRIVRATLPQFFVPGFVDCHTHAPQYGNLGLGLDKKLLDWLINVTVPEELWYEYTEPESVDDHASRILSEFEYVVKHTLREGTTTCCYFGCNSSDATIALGSLVSHFGQRALIGRVAMDCNMGGEKKFQVSDESSHLMDDIKVAANFAKLRKDRSLPADHLLPIATPRFALSCSKKLMSQMGKIVQREATFDSLDNKRTFNEFEVEFCNMVRFYSSIESNRSDFLFNLIRDFPIYSGRVQSHLGETRDEIAAVKASFPESANYLDVYDKAGLLAPKGKSIMAHCIHLTDDEWALMKKKDVAIAHCPGSNFNLNSGMMPLRRALEMGLRIGLGTDVGAGSSLSILDAMRDSVRCSKAKYLAALDNGISETEAPKPISIFDAFYMATLGGAKALLFDNITGSLEIGKYFDGLLIDPYYSVFPLPSPSSALNKDLNSYEEFKMSMLPLNFERFIQIGSCTWIRKVFVRGRLSFEPEVVPIGKQLEERSSNIPSPVVIADSSPYNKWLMEDMKKNFVKFAHALAEGNASPPTNNDPGRRKVKQQPNRPNIKKKDLEKMMKEFKF